MPNTETMPNAKTAKTPKTLKTPKTAKTLNDVKTSSSRRRHPKKETLQMVVTGGNMYEGKWKDGQFSGKHKDKKTGREVEGTWINGMFVNDTVKANGNEAPRPRNGLRSRLVALRKQMAH